MSDENQTPENPSQGFLGETDLNPSAAAPVTQVVDPYAVSDNTIVEKTAIIGLQPEEEFPDVVDAPAEPAAVTEEAPQAEAEEAVAILVRRGVNKNAECNKGNPSSPLSPKDMLRLRPGEALSILPVTNKELEALLTHYEAIDPTKSAAGRNWATTVGAGREAIPRGDIGLEALLRDDSAWRQSVGVTHGEGSMELSAGVPPIGEREGRGTLTGDTAMRYLNQVLHRGQYVRVPLWHSGIWTTFRTPAEQELLELERRVANEKITLGRVTNGLAYSNVSIYLNSFLFNFALALVTDATLPSTDLNTLKANIKVTDLPLLLWAMLCTMYPKGYRHLRPCVNNPAACMHIVDELLDLSKLCWTDNSALTEGQRKHMLRRNSKFTDIELTNFLSAHRNNRYSTIKLDESETHLTVVELRVPTLADWERSGTSWVDGIVAKTDAAFGSQLNGDARNQYILDQAATTSLRQYGHWIERIVITDKRNKKQEVIDDRETLEETIGHLSGSAHIHDAFFEGLKNYMNDATISQIAIPRYACPACGHDQGEVDTPETLMHPHLIPLDVATIFFTLLDQRVSLLLGQAQL